MVQSGGGLERNVKADGLVDERHQRRGAGKRVGRQSAGPDLGLQTAIADPFQPAARIVTGDHFHVDVELGAERVCQPVDSFKCLRFGFNGVDDRPVPRGVAVEHGHRHAIFVCPIPDDRAQPDNLCPISGCGLGSELT